MLFKIFSLIFIALVSASLGTSVCFAADEPVDKHVQIEVDDSYQSCARFLLTTSNLLEGTVSLKLDECENAVSSLPTPISFVILKPYRRYEFMRLTQKADSPWHYKWHYQYKIGVPSAKATADYVYTLPYASKSRFKVSQSYLGSHSHFQGSGTEYAVDIVMPQGTTILASRAGVVVAFRDDSNKGGDSKEFVHDANEIVIKHDDGTYASYVHLKQHGVTVKLGQKVQAGNPIGMSGATGWSTEPHLHFGIFRVLSGSSSRSLPFKMQTKDGVKARLMAGEFY